MKKITLFIMFLLAITVFIFPKNISIIQPNGGELVHGSQYIIKWTAAGTSKPFKITLWRHGMLIGTINSNKGAGNGLKNFNWTVGYLEGAKAAPAKGYQIKIKEKTTPVTAMGGMFEIVEKKNQNIAIIDLDAKQPKPEIRMIKPDTPSYEPENATFSIEDVNYTVLPNGKIGIMALKIRYNSKTVFNFYEYKGHPQDGPVYLNCIITNPEWPMDSYKPSEKGPLIKKVIFNHRLSIKYGGKNNLECVPKLLDYGSSHFELIFTPAHSGKVMGLTTMKKMKGAVFDTPDYCYRYYSPKIALRIFIHTKEGVKSTYKEFYLNKAPKATKAIPGELSLCNGGIVYW